MDDLSEFWGNGDLLGYAVKFSGFFPFAGWLYSVTKMQAHLGIGIIVFTIVICQLVSLMYAVYRDERRRISFTANMWIIAAAVFLGLNFFSATPADLASGPGADQAPVMFSMIFILLTFLFARLRTVAYQNGGGSWGGGGGGG